MTPPVSSPRIFYPLGDLWPSLLWAAILAFAGGTILVLSGSAVAGWTLAASALWVVGFFGASGILVGGLYQSPLNLRHKIVMLLALLFKLSLFGAGGILIWRNREVIADSGAILHLLIGIHLMPIVYVVRNFFCRAADASAQRAFATATAK